MRLPAASTPGAALSDAEDIKYTRHWDGCDAAGITFIPLAVETLGGWAPTAVKTLARMAILADSRRGMARDASAAFPRLIQQLSVILMRGNANMIIARCVDL